MTPLHRLLQHAPVIVALLWAGMLLGVSFIATPAKFLAPTLSRGVAFDVGRATFHVFSAIELVLALLLMLCVALLYRHWIAALCAILSLLIVTLQTVYLLPQLDLRVEAILSGQDLAPSSLHSLYVVAEIVKLALLLCLATVFIWTRQSLHAEPSDLPDNPDTARRD